MRRFIKLRNENEKLIRVSEKLVLYWSNAESQPKYMHQPAFKRGQFESYDFVIAAEGPHCFALSAHARDNGLIRVNALTGLRLQSCGLLTGS